MLPLSAWNAEAFAQKSLAQQLRNGFLYGVLFILALYNLIIFFYVRDISYLFYALFFGTMVLCMMAIDDFGDQYLWPGQGGFISIAPRLLLVDELSLGLAPIIVEELLPVLRSIATDTGTGILVVEQHVALVLEIADRASLLRQGRVTFEGTAAELRDRPDLVEAGYLGDIGQD